MKYFNSIFTILAKIEKKINSNMGKNSHFDQNQIIEIRTKRYAEIEF